MPQPKRRPTHPREDFCLGCDGLMGIYVSNWESQFFGSISSVGQDGKEQSAAGAVRGTESKPANTVADDVQTAVSLILPFFSFFPLQP